jgi:hypothetical protein
MILGAFAVVIIAFVVAVWIGVTTPAERIAADIERLIRLPSAFPRRLSPADIVAISIGGEQLVSVSYRKMRQPAWWRAAGRARHLAQRLCL